MTDPIASRPLGPRGKSLALALSLELASIWAVSLRAFLTLPREVVTHFGLSGNATASGDKSTFLMLPLAFSIAPMSLLAVTGSRFRLINTYPYLINLPAFFTDLRRLPQERRGAWVNEYFELVLALGVAVSLYLLFLLLMIYQGSLDGHLSPWFTPAAMIIPIALVVPFVDILSRPPRRVKHELAD